MGVASETNQRVSPERNMEGAKDKGVNTGEETNTSTQRESINGCGSEYEY